MDSNKWNRSVCSFEKSAGGESEKCGNCENKMDICKIDENSTGHEQKEQKKDITNDGNGDIHKEENETVTTKILTNSATIIISPLNRTLLKKPTTQKNVNNYSNMNDNNNNNKLKINSEHLNSEDLQKKRMNNLNCNVNEIDNKLQNNNDHSNNEHEFSKPTSNTFKNNSNCITNRLVSTFDCHHMLENSASANAQNNVESDNGQEQQKLRSQLQAQENQNPNLKERNTNRLVDDVDATHSSRNAHITGSESGVVGVCCGGVSVDIAAASDSTRFSYISNLNKKTNLTGTATTTTETSISTTAATITSSNHNSTSNTNEIAAIDAKCHNLCNNNNNNNNSNNNSTNNNSSNYCRK